MMTAVEVERAIWRIISEPEWADRVEDCLPPFRLDILMEVAGRTSRQVTIVARGGAQQETLARVESAFASR